MTLCTGFYGEPPFLSPVAAPSFWKVWLRPYVKNCSKFRSRSIKSLIGETQTSFLCRGLEPPPPPSEAQPPLSPPNEMTLCTGFYGEPPFLSPVAAPSFWKVWLRPYVKNCSKFRSRSIKSLIGETQTSFLSCQQSGVGAWTKSTMWCRGVSSKVVKIGVAIIYNPGKRSEQSERSVSRRGVQGPA